MTTTKNLSGWRRTPEKPSDARPVGRPKKNAYATSTPQTSTIYDDVLYGYQKEAADRIALQRQILLADQPGLGKTLMVLGGLERADMFRIGKNILIVTPIINAQTAWIETIKKFVEPRWDINLIDVSRGTGQQKREAIEYGLTGLCNIIVANHNAIDLMDRGENRVKSLTMTAYDAIIVDESHMVLPIRDHRKRTKFWQGLAKLGMTQDAMRIAVSGTPDRGKLENRYGTWLFLDPWNTSFNRWDWLAENFHLYEQKVAANRTVKMVGALKDKDKWHKKDLAMMIRRTKNEVLTELPPKRYVDVELDLHDKQMHDYVSLLDTAADEPMVFATRARQVANCQWSKTWEPWVGGQSAKLDWLIEWLDSRGYADGSLPGKVVIASQFSKVLHFLKESLAKEGITAEILDGATPQKQRDQLQNDFQNGDLRIILLSGQMGVGITLDAADDLIMFDSPYDPDRVEQIEDRVHRASNMHHVTIWNLIARSTIDQAIMAKVSKRYKITRSMLDGARGIDFERQVIDQLSKETTNE